MSDYVLDRSPEHLRALAIGQINVLCSGYGLPAYPERAMSGAQAVALLKAQGDDVPAMAFLAGVRAAERFHGIPGAEA